MMLNTDKSSAQLIKRGQHSNSTKSTNRYLYGITTLTFVTKNKGEKQMFFPVYIAVSKHEVCAMNFIHTKFFKKVLKLMEKLSYETGELIRVNAIFNWEKFREITGLECSCDLEQHFEWFFGGEKRYLTLWERVLIDEYGFGKIVDKRYVRS